MTQLDIAKIVKRLDAIESQYEKVDSKLLSIESRQTAQQADYEKGRLANINDHAEMISQILAKLDPLILERQVRNQIDSSVGKWLDRIPKVTTVIILISAIVYWVMGLINNR